MRVCFVLVNVSDITKKIALKKEYLEKNWKNRIGLDWGCF